MFHNRIAKFCLTLLLAVLLLLTASRFFAPVAGISGAKNAALIAAQSADQAGPADERESTLSLAEYRMLLDKVVATLDDAAVDGTEDAAALALEKAYTTLAAVEAVELGSGRLVELTPPFLPSLKSDAENDTVTTPMTAPEQLDSALARLRLIQSQIDAAGRDDSDARLALLDEIFARPDFNVQVSLWQRFLRWAEGILNWLFPNRTGRFADDSRFFGLYSLLGWTVALVSALAILLLFGYWVRNLLPAFISGSEQNRKTNHGDELPLTATSARTKATALAQAGNYRDAVRHLYLSALLLMEERGIIHHDRSLTNREVLARVARNADARSSDAEKSGSEDVGEYLGPVVETFDAVWYGVREPDEKTFAGYEEEIEDLNRAVEKRAKQVQK